MRDPDLEKLRERIAELRRSDPRLTESKAAERALREPEHRDAYRRIRP